MTNLGKLFLVLENTHFIRDLAYDASGRLWALYSVTYLTPLTTIVYELHQIDLVNVTATLVSTLPSGVYDNYYGLAFGPGMTMSTYCTAKANSLGCIPAISADGYASTTSAT